MKHMSVVKVWTKTFNKRQNLNRVSNSKSDLKRQTTTYGGRAQGRKAWELIPNLR